MLRRLLLLLPCLAAACRSGQSVDGLAPARATGGPQIVFDLTRKPLPVIPFPNDVATLGDSGSPTGLRLNSSVAAPTNLELRTRTLLDQLDGFGTFSPITVSFDADIDVLDLVARQNDADPTNDAIYLVQIDTGQVFPVDLGGGHFPYVIPDPSLYFPNDPFAQHRNLLFPSCGPLANVLALPGPACTDPATDPDPRKQVDQLASFYERSTRTLIVRPVLPLDQEQRYAVILTDRLRDSQGRAVVPPGAGINHPSQTGELSPVLGHLPAGVQLDRIAYTWAFTTQSTTRDLEAIQLGLHQQGRFAFVGVQYATLIPPQTSSGVPVTFLNLLPARDAFALDDPKAYIVPASELSALLTDPGLAPLFGPMDSATAAALAQSFRYIDYFVSASFVSPNFLSVPGGSPEDGLFQINSFTGEAHTQPETVTFLLAVPKRNGQHLPPFPTVLVGHEYMGSRSTDLFAFAGTFAKYGLASISIDAFGHGVDPAAMAGVTQVLSSHGLSRFATALLATRARDLDGDGVVDPGGDFFTADAFHTRDAVRQTVVDWMMLVRYLRTFDGRTTLLQSGGQVGRNLQILNGDFNNDGVPDIAGPAVWPVDITDSLGQHNFKANSANPGTDLFAFGQSLGGIVAGVLPAVEPTVKATVPVSGAGGLSDVVIRSQLPALIDSALLGAIGPFFTICPFDSAQGKCAAAGASTLVLVVRDVTRERELPIAPITLLRGDRLTVTNLSTASDACDRDHACATVTADASGKARVGVITDGPIFSARSGTATVLAQPGDRLRVGVLRSTGGEPQNIDTFGFDTSFGGLTFRAGDPLVAPAQGWGFERNTPDFRRLVQLWQAIVEPGDPIAYAPHWSAKLLSGRGGVNVPSLVVGTVGDTIVPVSTAIAMARAAGLVDKSDPTYGAAIDQVLIKAGVVEGMANLRRLSDPTSGPLAALGPFLSCVGVDCSGDVLVDATSYSQGTDGLNAPRLNPPLRDQLTRDVILPDQSHATSALLLPYLSRAGQHGFGKPQPGKPFDMDQFMANLIGRWLETRGRELHFDVCQAHEPPDCSWILAPPP
jgi:dienelactone hydrolase